MLIVFAFSERDEHESSGRCLQISRWDRYLGMTAVMTQVPVPTAILAGIMRSDKKFDSNPRREDGSRELFETDISYILGRYPP